MTETKTSQPAVHHRHWHYIKRKRQHALGINTAQMAQAQVFSLIGSIIAGVLLDMNKETLSLVVGVFVILPAVFDLDGSIGAALSAKINHHLEDTSKKASAVFMRTVRFALALCVSAGFVVGLVGATIASLFFSASFLDIFLIGWFGIILSGIIGFPIIALLSIGFRKKNINPDDVVGPIESSLFDILTVITITLMTGVVA